MITFINTFISYLILVIASVAVIIAGIFCGKKLRDLKDTKDAQKAEEGEENK